MPSSTFKNIDEYIDAQPLHIQFLLNQIRETVRASAPAAQETIKYAMPTFVLHGNLVHFAAFKNHIGFYAVPSGVDSIKKELSKYKSGKGSVQFPLDQPMPLNLISTITAFRVRENLEKARNKQTAKSAKKVFIK
ncbi:MAG TPA: DUF1801 domain-containing protein [Segetibacter sp.]